MGYAPTIGLEIHVELKTKTKMFCGCLNDPNEKHPNVNVCPVCMAHPGTLPVANEEAIKKVLLVGKALNGKLATFSQFDRKNYFYPDIPKGYQISQYKYPFVEGGYLEIPILNFQFSNNEQLANTKKINITRVHLEEDTGSLQHDGVDSLVDFNRAGVPLMELVTEPDLKNGEEVRKFAEELQLILRYLDVSDADMERGQMRVEVNISLNQPSAISHQPSALGTKVEIKNLNSLKAAEGSVEYEIKRQTELLEKGEKIIQETRGWDEAKQNTFSQREKESSHDYRYFPEPDLPVFEIGKMGLELILPELPAQKRKRFKEEYKIKDEAIEIFIKEKEFSNYFEEVVSKLENKEPINLAVNYLTSDLQSLMKEKSISWRAGELLVTAENFAKLINMIGANKITSRVAKDVLRMMAESGGDPSVIVEEHNLGQKNDDVAIDEVVTKIIEENKTAVEDYKNGKEASMQFLLGQGMRMTKGSISPELLKKAILNKIDER